IEHVVLDGLAAVASLVHLEWIENEYVALAHLRTDGGGRDGRAASGHDGDHEGIVQVRLEIGCRRARMQEVGTEFAEAGVVGNVQHDWPPAATSGSLASHHRRGTKLA